MAFGKRLFITATQGSSLLESYNVTPSSIGSGATNLTHTVTGGAGVEFTLSAQAGTRTIGGDGTFSITISQGANGGCSSRTLSFTATNDADSANVLTDTVSQSGQTCYSVDSSCGTCTNTGVYTFTGTVGSTVNRHYYYADAAEASGATCSGACSKVTNPPGIPNNAITCLLTIPVGGGTCSVT